jgi:lipopolysaccharide export LptBFGC system permease protein LptF
LPEAPEPPQPSLEDPDAERLTEQERLRWRQEEEDAKALAHEINNRLAWGSLYGFFGLWGFSVAMLRPVVSLILLLVVLYVLIFSDP